MPIRPVTIRYLELDLESDAARFSPRRSARSDLAFVRVDPPMPAYSRFLCTAVGAAWFWLERRVWTYDQWAAKLAPPSRVETWTLLANGVPAGYAELEPGAPGTVEVNFLGLLGPFIGQGLGAHLLT